MCLFINEKVHLFTLLTFLRSFWILSGDSLFYDEKSNSNYKPLDLIPGTVNYNDETLGYLLCFSGPVFSFLAWQLWCLLFGILVELKWCT